MKKLTQIGLLLALILGFAAESKAALLIEPLVGYTVGEGTTEFKGDDKDENYLNGGSFGGRLGYQKLGFQIGVDYLASNLNFDGSDLKTSEWGGFVGFEFPILIRVYAGYVFSGSATYSHDDLDDDLNLSGGTGPKVGIGFTLLPFLDLNIEYRTITYATEKDIEIEGGKVDLDAGYRAIMFGVSLPFTI